MKYIITLFTIAAVVLIACNSEKNNRLLGKPGDLKSDEYVINIERDTTLVTKNGALLKIPKGTLKTDKGSSVILEIKEAYSLEQMIAAGLTTQSNGEPLSSGGMIYINAKGGQDVSITQAIKVAIPTDYLSPDMKLFKGETNADGDVNWTEPTALPENKQLTVLDRGKQLFESKCSSCHAIGKDMTGPDLGHILKRFGDIGEGTWAYLQHGYKNYPYNGYYGAYTIFNDSTGKEKRMYEDEYLYYHPDPLSFYKCNLINRFGGVTGPILFKSDTSSIELKLSIYQYIQNESDRRQLPLPSHNYLLDCADSCTKYKETVFELNKQKRNVEEKRNKLVDESPALTEEIKIKEGSIPEPPVDFDNLVSPENNKGVYYQFTIETFGWYNIDILLSAQYGNEKSELFARIVGEYRERLDIFLIIPSAKIYAKGGVADDNSKYAFGFKNGEIFLPQNAKAYIMAVSESSSSVAYVLQEFTTSTKQELQVELKAASKEEFNMALTQLNREDLKISVKDTKNADSIRKTDADLKTINEELKKAESLKPKGCDCDCGGDAVTIPPDSSD